MKVILDYRSGYKPVIRLEAENDDEKHTLKLMWQQNVHLVSYNGNEKLAITCGPGET